MKPNDSNIVDNNSINSSNVLSGAIMSSQPIKEEESPVASEALDYLIQTGDDTNSLMFDLNELLKKDPTLSSLNPVKDDPDLSLDNSNGFGSVLMGLSQQQQLLMQQAQQQIQQQPGGGMPIPQSSSANRGNLDTASSSFSASLGAAGSSVPQVGSVGAGAFGPGSSVGSNVTASPLLASPPPVGAIFSQATASSTSLPFQLQPQQQQTVVPQTLQNIRHPLPLVEPKMEMDTTPPPNATIIPARGVGSGVGVGAVGGGGVLDDLDLDLGFAGGDYFTNDASKNVSLCPQQQQKQRLAAARQQQQQQQLHNQLGAPVAMAIKTEPPGRSAAVVGSGPVSNTGAHFLQNDDSLLFSSTSMGGHSGGATFAAPSSKDLLSSSVPASIFHNSPLSDILSDLSPAGAGAGAPIGGGGGGPGSPVSPNLPGNSPSHAGPERHSTLHKLLLRKDPVHRPSPVRSPQGGGGNKTLDKMKSSLSASNPLLCQQLSKSAPTTQPQLQLEKGGVWARREPRQHISSVCSVGEASSVADEVNEVLGTLSPSDLPDIESDDEAEEDANDAANTLADVGLGGAGPSTSGMSSGGRRRTQTVGEDDDSEEDSEDDSDDEDAAGSMGAASSSSSLRPRAGSKGSASGKKDRHFWQYNVQAKGPKGQKIVVPTKIDDPHVLNDIVDPVFSGDVQLQGIKHSGKARRGDGNDLTPNAKKLAAIGQELDQLSKVINELTPVSETPFTTRCKSRKEKNKLASRACRLKKKAQHEANKLKCNGLENEHHNLSSAINRAKEILRAKVDPNVSVSQGDLTAELDGTVRQATRNPVAGQTTEFVNRTIERFVKDL